MFFHSFAGFLDLWSGYNIIFYYRTSSVTFHRSIDNLWDTVCFLRRIAWTDTGLWTSLLARGTPVNVQEHSMIYWNDRLYVFGGVFAQAGECPFWLYHIQVRRNVFLLMYNSVSNVTWNLSTFFSLSFPTKIDKSTWIRCWDKKKKVSLGIVSKIDGAIDLFYSSFYFYSFLYCRRAYGKSGSAPEVRMLLSPERLTRPSLTGAQCTSTEGTKTCEAP